MKETFRLYYKDTLLGTFLAEGTDFPNISGHIDFNPDTLDNQKELKDYIDFSIKSSEKVLRDDNEYSEFIGKEEFKHQIIIDSLDWTLVTMDGTKTGILVPVFLSDNRINIRLQ